MTNNTHKITRSVPSHHQPGYTHQDPETRRDTMEERIKAKGLPPRITSTGFPIPPEPTPEDLIRGAVEADLPAPDARIVQAVHRAAAAANFDAAAMLSDPEFRKRAAVANAADADAVVGVITDARAANPALSAPFVTNPDTFDQVAKVIGTIPKADPADPAPSVVAQALAVAVSAGFNGLDLINLPSFRDAAATVDPADTAAVTRAIANSVAAHPELTRDPETWLDPRPGIKPTEFTPKAPEPGVEYITKTPQRTMAEKIAAKTAQIPPLVLPTN